jgi:hypothetical protein
MRRRYRRRTSSSCAGSTRRRAHELFASPRYVIDQLFDCGDTVLAALRFSPMAVGARATPSNAGPELTARKLENARTCGPFVSSGGPLRLPRRRTDSRASAHAGIADSSLSRALPAQSDDCNITLAYCSSSRARGGAIARRACRSPPLPMRQSEPLVSALALVPQWTRADEVPLHRHAAHATNLDLRLVNSGVAASLAHSDDPDTTRDRRCAAGRSTRAERRPSRATERGRTNAVACSTLGSPAPRGPRPRCGGRTRRPRLSPGCG